jgi:SPP1 gp7 family putative phage head morphogenesis protein
VSYTAIERATLRHRRWLISYENAAAREAVSAYTNKAGPILERLKRYEAQISEGRPLSARQALQARRDRARLRKLLREARDDIRDSLQGRLQGAARTELRVSVRNLSAGLPDGVTGRAPGVDLRTLILNPTAGRPWNSRVDASLLPVYQRIDAALAVAIDRGASMPNTARLLQAAIGAAESEKFKLIRIARTEIQRVSNEAAQATYKENRDVIRAVRYLATLDSRVCDVCRPYHRRVFELDNAGEHDGPYIPQHPNCRCFYAPVTRSISEILAARD